MRNSWGLRGESAVSMLRDRQMLASAVGKDHLYRTGDVFLFVFPVGLPKSVSRFFSSVKWVNV